MRVRRLNLALIVLLYCTQVWTVGISSLSVAIAGLLISSFGIIGLRKLPLLVYVLAAAAISSSLYIHQPLFAEVFQYSFLFSLSTIVNIVATANIIHAINHESLLRIEVSHFYFAVVIFFISIAALTPDALFGPTEGAVGLFNEKGIAGYFAAYVVMSLYFTRPSLVNAVLLMSVISYVLFIIQAGRPASFVLAIVFLLLDYLSLRNKAKIVLGVIVLFIAIASSDFFNEQIVKIELLQTGGGGVGRYAAAYIVSQLDMPSLLVGHGYGSYVGYRINVPELPDGSPYDYAGSALLELTFEVGLIATMAFVLIITKFAFRKISIFKTLATVMLLTFGVKHDVQMLTGIIFATYINRLFLEKYGKMQSYDINEAPFAETKRVYEFQ